MLTRKHVLEQSLLTGFCQIWSNMLVCVCVMHMFKCCCKEKGKITTCTELTTALARKATANVRSHFSPQLIHQEMFLGLLLRRHHHLGRNSSRPLPRGQLPHVEVVSELRRFITVCVSHGHDEHQAKTGPYLTNAANPPDKLYSRVQLGVSSASSMSYYFTWVVHCLHSSTNFVCRWKDFLTKSCATWCNDGRVQLLSWDGGPDLPDHIGARWNVKKGNEDMKKVFDCALKGKSLFSLISTYTV